MKKHPIEILWIEDNADRLGGLIKPLEKDGFKFDLAYELSEALECISKKKYDLILLDLILPFGFGMDNESEQFAGLHLLRKILNYDKFDTPVIVLSVVSDNKIIKELYDLGVKKVLPKGTYLPSKLRADIEEVLKSYGIEF